MAPPSGSVSSEEFEQMESTVSQFQGCGNGRFFSGTAGRHDLDTGQLLLLEKFCLVQLFISFIVSKYLHLHAVYKENRSYVQNSLCMHVDLVCNKRELKRLVD